MLVAFVHEDEAKNVREPVTDEDSPLKCRPISEGDEPTEADRQREVHKSIVPPGQRRQHEADEPKHAALKFPFPSHEQPHCPRRAGREQAERRNLKKRSGSADEGHPRSREYSYFRKINAGAAVYGSTHRSQGNDLRH